LRLHPPRSPPAADRSESLRPQRSGKSASAGLVVDGFFYILVRAPGMASPAPPPVSRTTCSVWSASGFLGAWSPIGTPGRSAPFSTSNASPSALSVPSDGVTGTAAFRPAAPHQGDLLRLPVPTCAQPPKPTRQRWRTDGSAAGFSSRSSRICVGAADTIKLRVPGQCFTAFLAFFPLCLALPASFLVFLLTALALFLALLPGP
jgi:hypothetical protein